MKFQVEEFRKNFPQLERKAGLSRIVYFDNAASTLKHAAVTDRVNQFNRFESSNVHRGAHQVSREGTENFEAARRSLQKFVNSKEPNEIIFTRGSTESINLIAGTIGSLFKAGDEILISSLEHHSNIVPWQIFCEKNTCKLKVIPFDREQGFSLAAFKGALTEKTKLVSVLHYSNSLGVGLPVGEIIKECRSRDVMTFIDAAQTPLTEKIDVQDLDCDFLCLSGHKMFGPYGIGILYGRRELLDQLPPYQSGGSMIDRVTFEKSIYAEVPQKFEAGTPNISGAIGLGAAVVALQERNISDYHDHVTDLRNYLKQGMETLKKTEIYEFPSKHHSGVLSFNVKGSHSSDIGTLLDKYGIAVRAGHHCTQPLMDILGVPGTVRVSLAPYNTRIEVEHFINIMQKVEEFF